MRRPRFHLRTAMIAVAVLAVSLAVGLSYSELDAFGEMVWMAVGCCCSGTSAILIALLFFGFLVNPGDPPPK